jgi:hypothetical protein
MPHTHWTVRAVLVLLNTLAGTGGKRLVGVPVVDKTLADVLGKL